MLVSTHDPFQPLFLTLGQKMNYSFLTNYDVSQFFSTSNLKKLRVHRMLGSEIDFFVTEAQTGSPEHIIPMSVPIIPRRPKRTEWQVHLPHNRRCWVRIPFSGDISNSTRPIILSKRIQTFTNILKCLFFWTTPTKLFCKRTWNFHFSLNVASLLDIFCSKIVRKLS